jgi:hypothetical protein
VDPLRPIPPVERTVAPVELTILTPLERERSREERERRRKRRQAASPAPGEPAAPSNSGLDVRV